MSQPGHEIFGFGGGRFGYFHLSFWAAILADVTGKSSNYRLNGRASSFGRSRR
jgi:hypothetical protein